MRKSDGILNLATGGATRTGNINIGSTTTTGQINIQTANPNNNVASAVSAINIGTTTVSKVIRIGSSSTAGTVTCGDLQFITNNNQNTNIINTITNTTRAISIGNNQTTGAIGIGTGGTAPTARQSGANINIANQASNACSINIMNGTTTAGSVNIANGTGATQTTDVNIGSGSTTGSVTIGNTDNSILLNAPTSFKSTKQHITYFTSQTNTLIVADILASNLFGSTYSLANPTTTNDVITVNIPTPTSDMEGMTLVFRKLRGALNTSTTNWTFTCPTSTIVVNSLTASAPPTLSTLSVSTLVSKFTVLAYSGSYYYFAM